MEELATQKTTIKSYVAILDSTIEEGDLLDFVVDSVIDRALIFMNRLQLNDEDVTDFYYTEADAPAILPAELERVLAQVVVSAYRNSTVAGSNTKEITSISDNGQTVHYSDKMADFLNSSDSEVFSNSLKMLEKYRLPTIVADTR
jgi:hypothetical protein